VKFDHLQEHSGLEPIIVYNGQNTGVASVEVQTLGETSTHMPHSLESVQKTNAELYKSVVGHCKIRARWVDKKPLVQGNCSRICNLADLSHYSLQGEVLHTTSSRRALICCSSIAMVAATVALPGPPAVVVMRTSVSKSCAGEKLL
jgi:hypothetical protein